VIVHVSNFRPVKRVDAVIAIFDRIRKQTPARLLLVGDGPDLAMAQQMARDLGIGALVDAVGAQEEVVPLLSIADLFLLPSVQESFGLAALEAMACEVPVIASRVGGLPEVIEHGVSGFLHPLDAVDEMAASGVALLKDPALHKRVAQAACRRVRSEFCVEKVVPMYEACYRELLS
jgi:N-acetyl-alpha-D-glucosaminyl L-malate synthase BshA